MKKISIGIVTYNNQNEILNVLKSIYNSIVINEIEVYVYDNASTDQTVNLIETNFKDVNLIKGTANLGFGRAHNRIINKINSKYHIIVNPDVTFDKNVIFDFTKLMDCHENYVLASPLVKNEDGSLQFLPKRKPNFIYILSGKLEHRSKFFRNKRDKYTMKNENITEIIEVDFCTGCFMFTRTEALKKINGFDERYFLHFEDVDLTLEMKKVGLTVFVPFICINHGWQRENIRNKKIQRIALLSFFKFTMKWGIK